MSRARQLIEAESPRDFMKALSAVRRRKELADYLEQQVIAEIEPFDARFVPVFQWAARLLRADYRPGQPGVVGRGNLEWFLREYKRSVEELNYAGWEIQAEDLEAAAQMLRGTVAESRARNFIKQLGVPKVYWEFAGVLRDRWGQVTQWRWYAKRGVGNAVAILFWEGGGQYSIQVSRNLQTEYLRTVGDEEGNLVWPALTVSDAQSIGLRLATQVIAGVRGVAESGPREFLKNMPFPAELEYLIHYYDGLGFAEVASRLRHLLYWVQAPNVPLNVQQFARTWVYELEQINSEHAQRVLPVVRKARDNLERKPVAVRKPARNFIKQLGVPKVTEDGPREFLKSLAIHPHALRDFVNAYIEAALWASGDDECDSFEGFPLAPETKEKMIFDCRKFLTQNRPDIGDRVREAGHDFFLTRQAHGAGFWDGDWPEDAGQRLTDAAHAFGSVELYLADDDQVYQV